jgi:glycine/D-amino acid oxidase-like deaminating enzyme
MHSLWMDGADLARRAPLAGDTEADVAIVGGGFTGLWTAYYLRRLDAGLREEREFGIEDGWRTTGADGWTVPRLRAAAFTPHCAAIQPGLLARGLADAVIRRGGEIAEGTRVTEIGPRLVRTDQGTVRSAVVVRATEAYTRSLRGQARRVAALVSHVIATEPIPAAMWRQTGWPGRATGLELRLLYPYLQRTADDRLVIGGRSLGYRYAGAAGAGDPRVWQTLAATSATGSRWPTSRAAPWPP